VELTQPRDWYGDKQKAFENSLQSHKLNEKQYNTTHIDWEFKIGDLVYVEMCNKLNRAKLDEIRIGPYPITHIVSKHIIQIKINNNVRKCHVNKLVPYLHCDDDLVDLEHGSSNIA
jgi:hypothetical protein